MKWIAAGVKKYPVANSDEDVVVGAVASRVIIVRLMQAGNHKGRVFASASV